MTLKKSLVIITSVVVVVEYTKLSPSKKLWT